MPIRADILTQLADALAELYPDQGSIRALAVTAGLTLGQIPFDPRASTTWVFVLNEAEAQNCTQALLNRAKTQYPVHKGLAVACQAYTDWVTANHPTDYPKQTRPASVTPAKTGETAMIDKKLKEDLVDALIKVASTESKDGRSALMSGIPPNIRGGLYRNDNQFVDLTQIIDQLEGVGRLTNGERPLVIITHNAWRQAANAELGQKLQEIEKQIEDAYGSDNPSVDFPGTPEILVFEGRDERVFFTFIQQAYQAASLVARLRVPRWNHGILESPAGGFGTGWLVAPGLLFTNHHVINSRDPNEPPASKVDFRKQAENTIAWFDYRQEGEERPDVRCVELVASDQTLDYALLRLENTEAVMSRGQFAVAGKQPALVPGSRLNIVQHSGGGPLRYAIRNNFYIGVGQAAFQLRYLTDTQAGSSGSPVLVDTWEVVAMHHAYREVPKETYKGDTVKYHNEGIAIHAILDSLPSAVRQEIEVSQGWK